MLDTGSAVEKGTLYVVATPIGNLADISQRALQVLASVDLIAAEDTRHTQRLLQHYQISANTFALHDHNEKQKAGYLLERLQQGQSIALVSDAGTPLISDPGYGLVNLCRQQGAKVVPVPGPCALIAALCCAGLPTDAFSFRGFSPAKTQARKQWFSEMAQLPHTQVFYESTHRIDDSLLDLASVYGEEHQVVLAKELTKTFETFYSGSIAQLQHWLAEDIRRKNGELVMLVAAKTVDEQALPQPALTLLTQLATLLPPKTAAGVVAEHYGLKKNALYQWLLANPAQ